MHKRVLLPLDGSSMAEQALPHAVEQAKRSRSELTLLRAICRLLPGSGLSSMETGCVQELACDWARDYLESIATQVRTRGIPVKVVILRAPPHEAITQFAETNGIGLIVLCSRGQSERSHWLRGSVADRVVREATIPVLLVQAQSNSGQQPEASRG
jgi:nucleotide-binding universal stress UspA family protein